MELDECAKIDGAHGPDLSAHLLPLMTPALLAVGVYALLLAWNDYLYQFMFAFIDANIPWRRPSISFFGQRRGAMELYDGGRSSFIPCADRDLLCRCAVHGRLTECILSAIAATRRRLVAFLNLCVMRK